MKTMAIVCEYNPFHNGHHYQIAVQKEELRCENVICVMSGNFVQRGDAAICDKWTRAKMALSCGCDLVIELPVVYATQSAERFAFGAVALIDQLNIVDYLSFGSECGDITSLSNVADTILDYSFKNILHQSLKNGDSYPKARANTLEMLLGREKCEIINQPNNILAIEYIKALKQLHSNVKPSTLTRFQSPYHSEVTYGQFASATAIRKLIFGKDDYENVVPPKVHQIVRQQIELGKSPVSIAPLENTLLYLLRTTPPEKLRLFGDVTEGIESRLIESAKKFHTLSQITEHVKTKRYTKTRIDRILLNLLLGIHKTDLNHPPQYIRVLGFNDKGVKLLSRIKKESCLPIITKTADASLTSDTAKRMFELDISATDIYSMLYPNQEYNRSGWDYLTSPIKMLSY